MESGPHAAGVKRQVIFNVQLLRFVAAFAILSTHTAGQLWTSSSWLAAVPWTAGVDMFFVISGFIMAWMTVGQFGSGSNAREFLRRRLIRIVPAYWFFTLIVIAVVAGAGGRIRGTNIDPAQATTSLLFIPWPRLDGKVVPILAQGWTLNYEMFFYLAFATALLFRRGLIALVVLFILLAAVHPFILGHSFLLDVYSDPIILEFVAGIAIAHLYLRGRRLSLLAALGLIATAVLWFATVPETGSFNQFVKAGIPAAMVVAALVLSPEPQRIGKLRRAIGAGGDASYTLYLSHTLVTNAVVLICTGVGPLPPPLVSALAIFAALGFSGVFYRTVEAPVTTWLGRRLQTGALTGPATVAP